MHDLGQPRPHVYIFFFCFFEYQVQDLQMYFTQAYRYSENLSFKRVATGKIEKEYSWHAPAMKFIGMKQLI